MQYSNDGPEYPEQESGEYVLPEIEAVISDSGACISIDKLFLIPIIKSSRQTNSIVKSATHDEDMHNLMTRAHDIESFGKPPFGNANRIDGCST